MTHTETKPTRIPIPQISIDKRNLLGRASEHSATIARWQIGRGKTAAAAKADAGAEIGQLLERTIDGPVWIMVDGALRAVAYPTIHGWTSRHVHAGTLGSDSCSYMDCTRRSVEQSLALHVAQIVYGERRGDVAELTIGECRARHERAMAYVLEHVTDLDDARRAEFRAWSDWQLAYVRAERSGEPDPHGAACSGRYDAPIDGE